MCVYYIYGIQSQALFYWLQVQPLFLFHFFQPGLVHAHYLCQPTSKEVKAFMKHHKLFSPHLFPGLFTCQIPPTSQLSPLIAQLPMGCVWRQTRASSETHEGNQTYFFKLLLMLCNKVRGRKVLSTLFCTHELQDAYNWPVLLWLTREWEHALPSLPATEHCQFCSFGFWPQMAVSLTGEHEFESRWCHYLPWPGA